MPHAGRTVTFNTNHAKRVEHGIVVAFEYVATVPVKIDGREMTAYVGVTKLGYVAHRPAASPIDVAEVAERLSWATD